MNRITEIVNNEVYYDGITLTERMKECHTPAISITLIADFKISEVFVHGVKSKTSEEEVTEDTLFQAGSISKPVFATAVMRLIEQGVFDLDKDIFEYLNGYNIPSFDENKHKITLRQILSHHTGLNLHGFAGYQQGQQIPTIDQILEGAFPSNNMKLKLINNPETGYQYSGGGYVLVQKLINDVCECGLIEMLDELVLSRFSMKQSTYSQPLLEEKHSEFAAGHNLHNLQIPGGYNIMPELSAAGLWTTPSDLARFGIEIMKALKGESIHLKRDTAELMTTKSYEDSPFGLGFAINQCEKGVTFGHGGSNVGYHSNMSFCPDDGSGIVIMLNSDIGRGICGEVTNAFKKISEW